MINKENMDSSTKQAVQRIESALVQIDPITVINRISDFRRINIRSLSDEKLFQAIQNTLLNNNSFSYLANTGVYQAGTPFFRVRRLHSSVFSEMSLQTLHDFWEPPAGSGKSIGRLHKAGESLLYTSPYDPHVAIKEMHLQENDWYALIKYTAVNDVKVNIIGGSYDYKKLGFTVENAVVVHELYNSFLRDEFSREVGKGTEYLYRISERIAKDYFDLPRAVQDAWCYSSVQDKQKYNVCFRPDPAHELLKLDGALICKKEKDDSIRPRCVAVALGDNAEFCPLGSDVQKSTFPEIVF